MTPGTIEVTGIADSAAWLVIYGQVPSGTRVEIDGPNGIIANGKVDEDGLLVHNGNHVGRQVLGVRTLLSALMYPGTYHNGNTEPILVRSGAYFVTPAGLAKHIMAYVRPTYPSGVFPAKDGTTARLLLIIGADGSIDSVQDSGGDPVALDACNKAVRQWRFEPFTANGRPISVHAPLTFVFAKDGSVASPVLSSMGGGY